MAPRPALGRRLSRRASLPRCRRATARHAVLAVVLAWPAVAGGAPPSAPEASGGRAPPIPDRLDRAPWLPPGSGVLTVQLAPGADLDLPPSASSPVGDRASLVGALHQLDPTLPDLRRTWRVPAADAAALLQHPDVVAAWHHPAAAPPPDLPPTTPDLSGEQDWAPLGMEDRRDWPGADGTEVTVANIEYDWDPAHEDLATHPPETVAGVPLGTFRYHGNATLGILGAADDGFGTTGAAPDVALIVVHPIDTAERYDVARAILEAVDHLQPGDILLIEQQAETDLGFAPPSSDPATYDAIALATAAGILVVEPAGNGAVDLDDPAFEGWFDRDHGGLVVGAIDPVTGRWDGQSSFGGRVDVHAHGRAILAPTTGAYAPDRFFPDADDRQAYTTRFGGTSGAAAQVAGAAAVVQSVHRTLHRGAAPPSALRAWLSADQTSARPDTGWPPLGGTLDLEWVLRAWVLP